MPIIFADEILRKQKDVAHIPIGPVGELSNYDQMRQECICMKLIHFNSPETISVLVIFFMMTKMYLSYLDSAITLQITARLRRTSSGNGLKLVQIS